MAKKDGMNVWTKNFAEIKSVKERIENYFPNKISTVREQRRTLEDDWMRFFNMWSVEHDEFHTYSGNSRLYVPEVRKNVEAQARQLTESAFPNRNFLDVLPGRTGTKKGAIINKNVRKWQIEQAGLRIKFHVFARQQTMLGTSPVYIPWRKETRNVFKHVLGKGASAKVRKKVEEVELFNGPDFIPRDLFKWYTLNPTKPDITKDGCFEIFVLNEMDLKKRRNEIVGLRDILEGDMDAFATDELARDVERMENMGIVIGDGGYAGVAELKTDESTVDKTFMNTTIFTEINLPEATMPGEDPNRPVPVMIELFNRQHAGVIKRNPYFHQSPPYVIGKYIQPNADEFYGQGIPKATQFQQYELNSKAEQAMDSATLALNPLAIIDPGLVDKNTDFVVEPGATWFASPAGIKLTSIPDVSAAGYQAMGILRSQMQEYSDRSPALPPQLLGKSRTATQSNIVSASLQIDIKSFQEANEIQVLNPSMEMWESLTDQYIEEDQVIMIQGNQSSQWMRALISKNASLGRYRYLWKGSTSLQDKSILGRSIIDLLKIVPGLPPEAQARINLNYEEMLKMLWTEAFLMRDADKLFGQRGIEKTDPILEHKMLLLGIDIEVLVGDDDDLHISTHNQFVLEKKGSNKELADSLTNHILIHQNQKEQKIRLAEERLKLKKAQQAALAQGAQQQQKKPTGQGSGNRTQLSPATTSGNLASGVRA